MEGGIREHNRKHKGTKWEPLGNRKYGGKKRSRNRPLAKNESGERGGKCEVEGTVGWSRGVR